MNYKKIASLSLSVIYLLSALPALADEDALHKSKSLNVETVLSDNFRSANSTEDAENGISVLNVSAPLVKDGADASGIIGDSPAENIFSVDGRRFILLDKNENGDYFVMADEEYGQSSERNFDADIKLEKLTSEDWGFNPQNSGSLAYKINNSASGLLSGNANNALSFTDTYTGDKTPKVIPESMLDDLLEHDWEIEAFYPDSAIHPNNMVAQSWIDSQAAMSQNAEKTVKAKLSYLSYTEFMQYKDKIGFKNYDSDDITAGMYLRTPFGYVRGTKNSTTYRLGNMQIRFKDDKSGLCFSAVNAKDASKTMVRPVMWLKADFFKNNKIDLRNAGANVLAEMHSLYTESDLSDIYDEDDVFWFSGKEKAWDWGKYPQHPKERSVLSDGYEEYSLPKHGPSPSENLFTIGGRRFIMLDRNAKGEYFVMADEEYGQLRPITPTDTTAETLGKMMGYEWSFNPENPNSAAAVLNDENGGILSGKPDNALSWVNGTYTGSKDKKVIPTEMTDDVLLKTWEIEPVYVFTHMSTAADQYAAYKEYDVHLEDIRKKGKEIIEKARKENKHIIVLAGRPYHVDPEVNHGIDKLITRLGAAVITEDSISYLTPKFKTTVLNQWTYHSRLYSAAKYCTEHEDIDLVQLVSFGCGLDAITTDETREILQSGNKLYTQLKIDEITNLGTVTIRLRSLFAALAERKMDKENQ